MPRNEIYLRAQSRSIYTVTTSYIQPSTNTAYPYHNLLPINCSFITFGTTSIDSSVESPLAYIETSLFLIGVTFVHKYRSNKCLISYRPTQHGHSHFKAARALSLVAHDHCIYTPRPSLIPCPLSRISPLRSAKKEKVPHVLRYQSQGWLRNRGPFLHLHG